MSGKRQQHWLVVLSSNGIANSRVIFYDKQQLNDLWMDDDHLSVCLFVFLYVTLVGGVEMPRHCL